MLTALEKTYIDAYRIGAGPHKVRGDNEIADWVRFGINLLLEAGNMLRKNRMDSLQDGVTFKADGSPVTSVEGKIEWLLRDRLVMFEPRAKVIGEETGGALASSGIEVAIDPVDGTWGLLSRTATYATTLAVFKDGTPILGMVSNPTTGEIGYATHGGDTRLLQVSIFGEPDNACSLPEQQVGSAGVLVNVHPDRNAGPLIGAFYDAWRRGGLSMVRSPGGSPSWALLEAARGGIVYLNLWSTRPTEAYDLAAGVMLVRGASGDVTDLEGKSIHIFHHQGPFIAGVDKHARRKVATIANKVVSG